MNEAFCMRIGEIERPDVEDFFAAFQSFLGLLKDVDAALAEHRNGNLLWRVTTLKKDPMPVVGVTPFPIKKRPDTSRSVQRELFGNISALNERGEWGRNLSDLALGRVEKIAKTSPRIGPSVIYIDSREPVGSPTASISRQTLDQVEILREPRSSAYGTIYGDLGSICIRNGNEFRVWDEESGRPVVCGFKPVEEQRIKDLLRKRVAITGMIQFNSHGWPISVKNPDAPEVIAEEELPTIEEMVGLIPNFTGGLSLTEFIEEMG